MHMAVHYSRDPTNAEHVFDEVCNLQSPNDFDIWLINFQTMWDKIAMGDVEKDGASANGFTVYVSSKVLSEQAAWEYVKTTKVC